MKNKQIILARGLPGSGKSTFAKEHFPGYRHFEADMYFINENGEYIFDASKLSEAHKWCFNNTENVMSFGMPLIVTNTFTTEKELAPYIDLAKKYNYQLISVIVEHRHENKNIHNVPQEILEKMKDRFQVKL